MLRITVEIVPFGDESMTRKIGEMVVANKGTTVDGSMYDAWATDEHGEEMYAELKGYQRSHGFWELLRLLLEVMILEKPEVPQDESSHAQRLKARLLKNWEKK